MDLNTEVDDIDDEFYNYQLIEFVTRGPKGKRKVDIVPSCWLKYNAQKGRMESPFLPPPYTHETSEMFMQFVKDRLNPLNSWPLYTVKLVGQAKTYEDGTNKLLLLEDTDNVVYTADSDFNSQEKAEYIKNKYKERVKQSDFPKILLQSTSISSSSSDDCDSSWEREELKSLFESGTKKVGRYKKNVMKKGKNGSKSKAKGIKPSSVENCDQSRSILVEKPIENKKFEIIKIQSENVCPSESRKSVEPLFETFDLNPIFNPHWQTHNNSKDQILNNMEQNLSSGESTSNNLANIINNNDKDCNGNNHQPTHKAVDQEQTGSHENLDKKNATEEDETHTKKHQDSSGRTYKNRQKDEHKFKVKRGCICSDTQLILAAIKGVSVTQKEILDRQERNEEMLRALAKKVGLLPNSQGFIGSNNLQLPFKEVPELKEFDDKLNEEAFRNEFILSLHSLVDKDLNVSKSVLNILRKYFSKQLASQFTNVRRMANKLLLKDYKIHQCILDAIIETHGSVNNGAKSNFLEKSASDAIGIVLSNVRDWDRGRQERQTAASNNNNI